MKVEKFEDLGIWILSIEINKAIYNVSNNGDFGKDYGLRDQIRRAIISVSGNIVEGLVIICSMIYFGGRIHRYKLSNPYFD